jgi:hypothetical protein
MRVDETGRNEAPAGIDDARCRGFVARFADGLNEAVLNRHPPTAKVIAGARDEQLGMGNEQIAALGRVGGHGIERTSSCHAPQPSKKTADAAARKLPMPSSYRVAL